MYYIWNTYVINFGGDLMINRLIKTFFNAEFLKFIIIGIINACNGIWIAYVYSLFINNEILAYILGFLTSLCISYILNSLYNFRYKLNIKKFLKFIISNIPNFVIQVFSVVVLLNILNVPKIISYAISAVISVPITFALVKIKVFKNEGVDQID